MNWGPWFSEWFYSYHEFYEHLDFWDALVACLPGKSDNSKFAETYNSRDLRGIHLFHDVEEPEDVIVLQVSPRMQLLDTL